MHWRETSVVCAVCYLIALKTAEKERAKRSFFSISFLRLQFHKCSLFAISPEVVCFEIRAAHTLPVSGDEILSGEERVGNELQGASALTSIFSRKIYGFSSL